MQLRIRAGFLLAAGAFLLADRWGLFLPFLLAAALHEAGHLAALWALGIPVRELELRAGGAVLRAELRGEAREAWALGAGPGLNLLLAALFWRPWPLFGLCNLSLGLWNLLPLPGRDGWGLGRLARDKIRSAHAGRRRRRPLRCGPDATRFRRGTHERTN